MDHTARKKDKLLIVVGGPTASGKTALAIALAQRYKTEIISTDSRQFYREMNIGTAKPTEAELRAVPHHFINSLSMADDYSVGDFEKDALRVLDRLFQTKDVAVAAGGSGLFIQALCKGLDQFPEVDAALRQRVSEGEKQGGLAWLQSEVARLDPVFWSTADQQNPARLRRALEVSLSAGVPYSTFLGRPKPERPFEVRYLLPDWPRPVLYQRIDARVDQMIAAGLEEEVRGLLPFQHRPAFRTVGYEEWLPYFAGAYTRAEAIDKIKQHSRNYAKRQLTWFRKYGEWELVAEGRV